MLWFSFSVGSMMSGGYTTEQRLQDLDYCVRFESYVVIIAFAALVTGMALYSYMYNQKSANMIHSLPVDRTQLLGTTLISGWAFLIVPLFVTAVITSMLCIAYEVPGVSYVWIWFFCVACMAFIAFSIVSICALFTGHIVVLPMYAFVVCYLSWVVYYLVTLIVTTFGFGVTVLSNNAESIAQMFCPPQCFYNNLTWIRKYDEFHKFVGLELSGEVMLILYMILAVVFYVAAYVIYRKRKIEQAGDFLTVNWVKPIFRGAVACVGGIFGGMLIRSVLIDVGIGCGMPVFVVFMLVAGVICYFAANMFIQKSFHVFKKRDWMGCGVASVLLLAIFFGMYGLAEEYETYVPELEEIEYAEIRMGYEITLYGEDAEKILDIQKDIVGMADYVEDKTGGVNRYYANVTVRYYLKDGQWVTRRYALPQEDEKITPICEKILRLEEDEENFLANFFGRDYSNIMDFTGGRLEAYFVEPEDKKGEDWYPDSNYESKKLTAEQAKELYHAIIADTKAGTLMKYNVSKNYIYYMEESQNGIGYAEDYFKTSDANISIEYLLPTDETTDEINMNDGYYSSGPIKEEGYPVDDNYAYYNMNRTAYLSFGPDCENIINKLIEFGIIKSAEHIWWGQAEELMK